MPGGMSVRRLAVISLFCSSWKRVSRYRAIHHGSSGHDSPPPLLVKSEVGSQGRALFVWVSRIHHVSKKTLNWRMAPCAPRSHRVEHWSSEQLKYSACQSMNLIMVQRAAHKHTGLALYQLIFTFTLWIQFTYASHNRKNYLCFMEDRDSRTIRKKKDKLIQMKAVYIHIEIILFIRKSVYFVP